MTVQTREPVLRRKLAPRAPTPEAKTPELTGAAQGVGRSFARALTATAQLVAESRSTTRQSVSQSELLDSIDTDAFVGLLSAGDTGPALAILDQAGFSAVIEAMTIGYLGPRAPVPRRPTPTDASLLAEMFDKTLEGLSDDGVTSLRFERAVPDHRLLPVLLDETQFDLVTHCVTLVSGSEKRAAQLILAFPHMEPSVTEAAGNAAGGEGGELDWDQSLSASVMRAPASLRAELGRVTMPLSKVLELGVGGALTLPLSALEEVQLAALDGTVQAVGRLGQSRGMRAVRLTSWPNGKTPNPIMSEMAAPSAAKLDALPQVIDDV